MLIRDLKHPALCIPDWETRSDQTWCVLGGNASGKSLLAQLIADRSTPYSRHISDRPAAIELLSFESIQEAYEQELENEDTDFLDRVDYGTTGLELLLESGCSEEEALAAAARHGLAGLLQRGCRQFSTGELRRIYLLRAALLQPDLLILDEPYEGLDTESRQRLDAMIRDWIAAGKQALLLANRLEDVPSFCTHILLLAKGQILLSQDRDAALSDPTLRSLFDARLDTIEIPAPSDASAQRFDPLVEIKDARIRYSDTLQFSDFSWTLKPGEHTLITGPNGSGKSTLLALLTGDHPQCYSNHLTIFGYRRGTGESIWDIKQHIGYVSSSLHRDYRVNCTAETVVVSGFHDSIGLYEPASAAERSCAKRWLALFSLSDFAQRPFRSLSYGQQRLTLIARALVKHPPLLILDEPTQGLDDLNRHLVLTCVEKLSRLPRTTLLFVSHRSDEHLSLFTHKLHFEPAPDSAARYRIRKTITN